MLKIGDSFPSQDEKQSAEKPSESKPEEKPAEGKPEEKPSESKPDEKPFESKPEEKPSESEPASVSVAAEKPRENDEGSANQEEEKKKEEEERPKLNVEKVSKVNVFLSVKVFLATGYQSLFGLPALYPDELSDFIYPMLSRAKRHL